jgi:hypothetical protein
VWRQGRDHLHRLALGELVEARQHRLPVLRRDDLGGLDDARQAKLPVAERLDDRGDLLDQLRRDLAVVGGALREVQLAVEEVEERRVAQLGPSTATVEVGERDEELGERVVFAPEERVLAPRLSVSSDRASSVSLGSVEGLSMPQRTASAPRFIWPPHA